MAATMAALLLCAASGPKPTLEESVLEQINFARAHPREVAEQLRTYRTFFRGNIVRYPGNITGLITAEGTAAVDEAITFLEKQEPLEPIAHSDLLALSASDLVADQGLRGAMGHVSSNGDDPGARLVRRGGGPYIAETVTYGPSAAVEVVRQLIVDDNVPDRGHRKILYATEFIYAGVACGAHAKFRMMCVVDYSSTRDGK